MTEFKTSPYVAESLLRFFAGSHLQDEISGDLQERLITEKRSDSWYWLQTLRSIPALLHMNLKNMSTKVWLEKALFLLTGLSFIWLWELGVAQTYSWPAAKAIMQFSPLTPTQTCKTLYVLFYGAAIGLLFTGISVWSKSGTTDKHFKHVHFLLIAFMASIPIVYYCINPGPYDGALYFRAFQISLVWTLFITVLVRPTLKKRNGDKSTSRYRC